MNDDQIDTMVKMHRYLMKCEIKLAFDKFCAENGNEDYRAASLQEAFNDTEWEKFAKWFKMIREE
jgi:hypothetical protein